jgi:hypothetical protein
VIGSVRLGQTRGRGQALHQGFNRFGQYVVDEASRVEDELFKSISPMLALKTRPCKLPRRMANPLLKTFK